MHRSTSAICPASLCIFTLVISGCSGSGPDLVVEKLPLDVRDTFETRIPGFEGFLSRAVDCAIDEQGSIYVLDQIECHVVVFDRDLVAVNVIGRKGEGPGEMMINRQSSYHYLATGGGYVVTATYPNLIHVFDKEGHFLNRFVPDPYPSDLIVRDDGTIVTHTISMEFPIVEYDSQGDKLRQYGRAMIQFREDNPYYWHYMHSNSGFVAPLPDEGILTFNNDWLRSRLYRNGEYISEFTIDLKELVRLVETPRESMKTARMIWRSMCKHSPERINRLAESGLLTDNLLPITTIVRVATDRGKIWCTGGRPWLYELSTNGHVIRIFEFGDGGSHTFAVRNGQIVFCLGTRISVGTIPETR